MDHKHEHDNECECGCNCVCEHELVEYNTVTLLLENGKEEDFAVIEQFKIDDNEYIALLPVEEEESDLGEDILLFKYYEGENNNFTIETIEDDEEFEKVCDYFESLAE